jgi:hypothetical protein
MTQSGHSLLKIAATQTDLRALFAGRKTVL